MSTDWLDVSDTTPRINYTATGGQTAFSVPFLFFTNDNLNVYQNGVLLVLNVGYTVTGAENASGGTVMLTTGATASDSVLIARSTALALTTHIPPSGPLDVPAINIQFSKFVAMLQEERDRFDRSLTQPDNEVSQDMTLPADRANKLLGFDSNGAPIAVLGPSSVADQFVGAALVESKAVAQVTAFGPTTNYLLLGGSTAAGSASLAGYIKGSGSGSFNDGGGTSWKPVTTGELSTPVTGADTTGATDARAAIQAVIDSVSAAGGGYVHLGAGKTYRVVINGGVTELGLIIKPGVTLFLNDSTLNLECTGDVYGVRMRSNSHIIGPGTIAVTVSASLSSSQSIFHAPVSLGGAYGSLGTVASPDTYASVVGWSLRNFTITTIRDDTASGTPGGTMLCGYGGVSRGLIEDIVFPANAKIAIAIGFDWAFLGTIISSDIPTSRTNFNAGTAYTTHPHDIEIRRVTIGDLSVPNAGFGSHGLRFSGVYGIRVDGVTMAGTTYAGIFHTAGDCGFEFAPSAVKPFRYKGTRFRNIRIEAANHGWGVYSDCYADNVAAAIALGYASILPTQGETDMVFDNVSTQSDLSALSLPGFLMQNQLGGELRNCSARLHSVGVLVSTNIDQLKIIGGDYNSSYLHGIHVTSGNAAEDLLIDGARCSSNGIGGGGSTDAGIMLDVSIRATVRNCVLGGGGESYQDYGIRITANSQDAIIENNEVFSVATSGVAYSLAGATDYGVLALFSGNRAATNVTTKIGGLNIIPYVYQHNPDQDRNLMCRAKRASLTGDTTPTGGAWKGGDTIFFTNPAAGGKIGSTCTATGSPGTWKQFGAVDA